VATFLKIFLKINWPNLGQFEQKSHGLTFMTDWAYGPHKAFNAFGTL